MATAKSLKVTAKVLSLRTLSASENKAEGATHRLTVQTSPSFATAIAKSAEVIREDGSPSTFCGTPPNDSIHHIDLKPNQVSMLERCGFSVGLLMPRVKGATFNAEVELRHVGDEYLVRSTGEIEEVTKNHVQLNKPELVLPDNIIDKLSIIKAIADATMASMNVSTTSAVTSTKEVPVEEEEAPEPPAPAKDARKRVATAKVK